MWSSKELLFISIAMGLVFCCTTIYAQPTFTELVNRQIPINNQATAANPLLGTGLARCPGRSDGDESTGDSQAWVYSSAPPGSGRRWTPLCA
ncbi:unnamed protein product [Ectocarpus sp. 4 AP-2014]